MFFDKSESCDWSDTESEFSRCNEGRVMIVVASAVERLSKAGNEMLEVKMTMYDAYGNKNPVNDYLLKTDNTRWKTIAFMKSIGMYDKLSEGKVDIKDIIDAKGLAINEYEKAKKVDSDGNEKDVEYCRISKYLPFDKEMISSIENRANNNVNDLVGSYGGSNGSTQDTKKEEEFDDDIPF